MPPLFGSYSGGDASAAGNTPISDQHSQPLNTNGGLINNSYSGFWRPVRRNNGASWFASGSGVQRTPATTDLVGWTVNKSGSRLSGGCQENNLLALNWIIHDVRLLRDEVEQSQATTEEGRSVSAGAGRSDVWTSQPIFGDAKWKLELVRTERFMTKNDTTSAEEIRETSSSAPLTVLSAYLTSLVIEGAPQDVTIPASIMIGIRVPSMRLPLSSNTWLWSHHSHFTFQREAEFFECHSLPSMSDLLDHSDIAELNAFELVVQIGTGIQMSLLGGNSSIDHRLPFQIPDKQFVPISVVAGLEGLIDDAGTADVALVVRERGIVISSSISSGPAHSNEGEKSCKVELQVVPWPVGHSMPRQTTEDVEGSLDNSIELPEVVVRDRVLWVHSSILRACSDYFRTMLDSGFAEGQGVQSVSQQASFGGRIVKILRIPDADFATAQALVRFFYVSKLDLMEAEDVRSVIFDDDWATLGLPLHSTGNGRHGIPIWHWRSLEQVANHDTEGVNLPATTPAGTAAATGGHRIQSRPSQCSMRSNSSASRSTGKSPKASGEGEERQIGSLLSIRSATYGPSSSNFSPQGNESEPGVTIASGAHVASGGDTLLSALLQADPHPHPALSKFKASSLSIYRLAHRLHLTTLADLAKVHFVASLDPNNAFAALLATHLYSDLHESVRAFVLANWTEVSASADFERCCDEVGAGEWGSEAGKALRGFMRALAIYA